MLVSGSLTERALDLVNGSSDGVIARTAGPALGVTLATASCALGRLYWAGRVDRRWEHREGRFEYIYTPREAPCRRS